MLYNIDSERRAKNIAQNRELMSSDVPRLQWRNNVRIGEWQQIG